MKSLPWKTMCCSFFRDLRQQGVRGVIVYNARKNTLHVPGPNLHATTPCHDVPYPPANHNMPCLWDGLDNGVTFKMVSADEIMRDIQFALDAEHLGPIE